MTWNIKNKHGNTDMVLWDGTVKKNLKKKKCPWSHLREVLPLLTRCPSPISPWCAAWRPSCGHGWGGPPAPASSGPRFHSSRAKVGGTNPPRSSVEAGNSGGEKKKKKEKKNSWEKHSKEKVESGNWQEGNDRMGMTDGKEDADKKILLLRAARKWKRSERQTH